MATRQPPGEDRYADPRDDYRNGFLDAVMFCKGLDAADERALSVALEVLHRYRDANPVTPLQTRLAVRGNSYLVNATRS